MKSKHNHAWRSLIALAVTGILTTDTLAIPVYWSGHADIVPLFDAVSQSLDLRIRFDGNSKFEDGSTMTFQQVEPETVAIRAPNPALVREMHIGDPEDPYDDYDNTGTEWDFVGADIGESFYILPQANDPQKPFFGFATDTLGLGQWTGSVRWELLDVISAPTDGEFSQWQTDFFGFPNPLFATSDGVDPEEDSFPQGLFGHDHYNWGFTKPGVYKVVLGATATHSTYGEVTGSATFTFLAGDEASPLLPGDYNGDGAVDAADYTVWRDTLGQTGTGLVADGDLSGEVDQADYDLWSDNYGAGAAGSLTQTIPEPGSFALIAVGALCAVRRLRRP